MSEKIVHNEALVLLVKFLLAHKAQSVNHAILDQYHSRNLTYNQ